MFLKEGVITHNRIAVSIFYFLIGVIFASWASRIPDIKNLLNLSEAALGGVLFAIPIGQISAIGFSAYFVGRFGSYRMLSIAIYLAASALFMISLTTTITTLTAALFCFGASLNLTNLSVNTQGVNVENLYGKTIMGSLHGLWSLGCFVGALISTITSLLHLPITIHFASVSILVLAVGMSVRNCLVKTDIKSSSEQQADKRNFFRRVDFYILLLGVTSFCAMICEGTMFDWSGVYFAEVVNAPDNLIRLGYIVCMSTMTTGRFLSDWFITRFGVVKVLRTSSILIATGLMISVLAPTLVVASIGFFIVGFGISSTVPTCYSLSARSKTLRPATALATVTTIGYIGFLIGPPLIGFIAHSISLRWTFAIVAAVALVIFILAGKLKREISKF